MSGLKPWKSLVLWSVISAAFIGPGTVTTAISAGSRYQLDLLWAVVVATLACMALQEISARITIASGLNMGDALDKRFGIKLGAWMRWLTGGVVIMGCIAYEAGNVLGAVAGLHLLTGMDARWLTGFIGLLAGMVLWGGSSSWISRIMMVLVAVMGLAFIHIASQQDYSPAFVLARSLTPTLPVGSEVLILGLVGTTIVPYNLFLASGITGSQTVPMMRAGLITSVAIGGLITAAVLIAGTSITTFSSFAVLFEDIKSTVGPAASMALAVGLFAAGFSSTITAPFASSVIAGTVLRANENVVKATRLVVLAIGVTVGILGLKPIPVILFVQALNGLTLPLLAIFLVWMINDSEIVQAPFRHHPLYNAVLLMVLGTVLLISLTNVDKAIVGGLGLDGNHLGVVTAATIIVTFAVSIPLIRVKRR